MRIGVLTTHPIQYQVPWFRLLSAQPDIDLEVMYCMIPDATQQGAGFGIEFKWDIPLLDGYRYRVLENVAGTPSVTHFSGCDTPSIFSIVRDESWDAFIVNGWVAKSCLQLLAACRRYKVPCIVRGESNALRDRVVWKKLLQRTLVHQYSSFLSIGQANQSFYHQYGIASDRIFSTPYCIDNERFLEAVDRVRPSRADLLEKFGLDKESSTFLYCGKFEPKKRPMDLLLALRSLTASSDLPVQMLMVGDGVLREKCEMMATQEGLPVTFSGFLNQKEIIEAYIVSDCLILASDYGETWGLVVNEAMACGLPAIVSDQSGCHLDLIRKGETGYVYPTGDIQKLTDCMQRFASTASSDIRKMGVNARQKVLTHYNYEQVVTGVKKALHHSVR